MLGLVFIPDPSVKTLLTDGINLWYNPDYFDKLPFGQACFAVAHEAFHCGANHPIRCDDRDLELYQRAADYVTNPEIINAGFEPIDGILYEPRFAGKSVEKVYNILDRERQRQGGGGNQNDKPQPGQGDQQAPQPGQGGSESPGSPQPGKGSQDDQNGQPSVPDHQKQIDVGGCGGVIPPRTQDGKPLSQEQRERLRDHWEITATHARMVAKRIGNSPGAAETIIDEIQNPKGDWRETMRQFMRSSTSRNYSWLRPDRRLITTQKLYIPSLMTRKMPPMAIGIDTSISMTPRMLEIISNEFNAILFETEPAWIDAFFCDTEIRKTERFEPDQYPIPLCHPGRGGTRVTPVFQAIEELDYVPSCLVYFTDLEVKDFPEEPPYPVLWASTEGTNIPWGELLLLDEV